MFVRRVPVSLGVVAALCLLTGGCASSQGITQTGFERQAGDGASIFAAAAETLRFVHSEPASFTVEYGAGSMINYEDQVATLPDDLTSVDGTPDSATLDELVAAVEPAILAIQDPCLQPNCDYQAQIAALDAARDALLASIGE